MAAKTSHNLNSTLKFPSTKSTLPVTSACDLINAQSSNLGFKCAISAFCKNASFSSGLNNPDCLKLFSTTFEISSPIFFFFNIFSNFSFDKLFVDSGDTAIGNGDKLPLVISTSINAKAFVGKSSINKNIYLKILYPFNISLASKFNCKSFHLSYPVLGTLSG